MNRKIEDALSTFLAIAAVAVAVSVVWRTFFQTDAAQPQPDRLRPQFVKSWRDALPIGIQVGDTSAPVTVVELADLECPACRGFYSTLQKVLDEHPHQASLVYVSYPLQMHRFALSAARGAECAERLGKFAEWVDIVYAKQDSLGLKSWGAFARDAGIADTAAIGRCAMDPAPVARIEAGRAFGDRLHVRGTPTVIVNGWLLPYTPTGEELSKLIESLAAGKIDFDTASTL